MRLLGDRREEIISTISKELNSLTIRPSATLDLWTTQNMNASYMGITLHYPSILSGVSKIKATFIGMLAVNGIFVC